MKTKQGREEGGREGLSGEVTLEQKGIPGQENSRRKGPEAHAHWNALEMTIVRSGCRLARAGKMAHQFMWP